MEPKYDTYRADADLAWSDIYFLPERYEVWMGGRKIKSGDTDCTLALDLNENGAGHNRAGQIEVWCDEPDLIESDLMSKIVFDMFGTQGNRIVLLTVPSLTNAATCVGMTAMQHMWPHSREKYDFKPTEPYCCSVFTVDGEVVKITFSLANPEKLIEFYGF